MSSQTEIGLRVLASGNRSLARARLRQALGDDDAEVIAREALEDFRSGMNWLEDTPDFEVAHFRLDEAGAWVRGTFGCTLSFDAEKGYEQRCPVFLAHRRIGLSIEARNLESLCSVCGLDSRRCRHVTTKLYSAPQRFVGSVCNVCQSESCVGHDPGASHEVECFHVVTSLGSLDAVAFVSRPSIPDARIMSISVSAKDIAESVGPGFRWSMAVDCNFCLRPCSGVRQLDDEAEATGTP